MVISHLQSRKVYVVIAITAIDFDIKIGNCFIRGFKNDFIITIFSIYNILSSSFNFGSIAKLVCQFISINGNINNFINCIYAQIVMIRNTA